MGLKFFNLHGHTGFSLYDGYGSIEDYADFMLKNAGEDSGGLSVTDHGHMNSAGYFAAAQKKFKAKGTPVKLLWGCEAYYIPSVSDWQKQKLASDEAKALEKKTKKEKKEDTDDEGLVFENEKESKAKYFDPIKRRNHLVLVAYNRKGLSNLFRLVTRSHREGFYKKPRIDFKMLQECNEGLIASSACLAGIPSWCSMQSADMESAHKLYDSQLLPLMEVFGKDRFFLELQFNKIPEQQISNEHIVGYAKKTGYNLIATADSHYPKPENWKDRELYRMLGYQMKGQEIDKSILEKSFNDLDAQLFLKNGDQMFQSYKDSEFGQKFADDNLIKEAIERSYHIAHDLCEVVTPDEKIKFPKSLKITSVLSSFDLIKDICVKELKAKKLDSKKEYIDRLAFELEVIDKLNVSDYFLTLKEIIDVLKKHMLIGPGRGSGAGCMVNYLLGVTLLDPIKEGLLFERFLSASRSDLPDVDTDVELREEALEILKSHFGPDNVIAISNYNKLQLKSIVKDLSKLHGVEYQEVNAVTSVMEVEARDKILESINHDQKLYEFTFEKAKEFSPTFAAFIEKNPKVGENIEALYQEIKSIGRHAGGIIVIPDAESCLPIIRVGGIDQSPITEGITAQHLKYFGLVKYDILGLATLKIIRGCIENVLKGEGNLNPTIEDVWEFYNEFLHPDKIDKNDEKVFKNTYQAKRFPSIFQFEKENVQNFCAKAQPEDVDDISAITALWRPGPLKGQADKRYLYYDETELKREHKIIQEFLGDTRGLLVYQEQFMLLASALAGFSLEEADQLRKILVKPSQELGEELKKKRIEAGFKFIAGAIEKGMSKERATRLWDKEIMGFISYGFNKSHSVAYAYNSYQCAWLYTYYPDQWVKACLEKDPEPSKTINSIRSLGNIVSKVDVNYSAVNEWSNVENTWLPPLTSLKGLGDAGGDELIRLRPKEGFKTLEEFFFNGDKWRWSKLNKRCIEALFKSEGFGSLNCVGQSSRFANYKHLHDFVLSDFDKFKKRKGSLEGSEAFETQDWTVAEKILFQKELTGFYDKGLVVNKFMKAFREFDIKAIDEYSDEDGPKMKIWGIVEEIEQKTTKNNKVYYIITVSGSSEQTYKFKAWLKETEASMWKVGNILVFGVDYSNDWGYSLSKKFKYFLVTK